MATLYMNDGELGRLGDLLVREAEFSTEGFDTDGVVVSLFMKTVNEDDAVMMYLSERAVQSTIDFLSAALVQYTAKQKEESK